MMTKEVANYEAHHIDARRRTTEELVRIAAEARARGMLVTFKDLGERPLRDLLKIVAAGGRWEGRVRTGGQATAQDRVCAADALLPGFLLSRFLLMPTASRS